MNGTGAAEMLHDCVRLRTIDSHTSYDNHRVLNRCVNNAASSRRYDRRRCA